MPPVKEFDDQFTFPIRAQHKHALESLAKIMGTNKSALMRRIVESFLARPSVRAAVEEPGNNEAVMGINRALQGQ